MTLIRRKVSGSFMGIDRKTQYNDLTLHSVKKLINYKPDNYCIHTKDIISKCMLVFEKNKMRK